MSHAADSAGIPDAVSQSPTVFVVDPDLNTAKIVKDLLQGYYLTVQAYASGREFFAAYAEDQPGCLVLEPRIFDISGHQIQQRLTEQNRRLPIVYVASALDVSTAVALMRGGAIHVLEKPLRSAELFNAIQEAVAIDEKERHKEVQNRRVRELVVMLTPKERQIVNQVASMKSTKAIASELDICPRAVELRRRGVMEKLGLNCSLELLRFALLACQECDEYLHKGALQ